MSAPTILSQTPVPPAARPAWEITNRNLQSQDALLSSVDAAGIAARVINTPTAFIEDADGKAPAGAIESINDVHRELRQFARLICAIRRRSRCRADQVVSVRESP